MVWVKAWAWAWGLATGLVWVRAWASASVMATVLEMEMETEKAKGTEMATANNCHRCRTSGFHQQQMSDSLKPSTASTPDWCCRSS